jgi:hypothetical protein
MKLTKTSQSLMNYFNSIKEQCIKPIKFTKNTENILGQLYDDIIDAHEQLQELKKMRKRADTTFYQMRINRITNVSQIVKPSTFLSNYFPANIRAHIDKHAMFTMTYTFAVFDKKITVIFTVEEDDIDALVPVYNKYIEHIYLWLHVLNSYAAPTCSQTLTIYLYFTSFSKTLPDTPIEVLDVINVNTAVTTSCQPQTEIVVYRKEEWFKVLLHESFHSFGLDFSNMNNEECTSRILKIFPVKSEVNLFESYCEFWAEIVNVLFCSFRAIKDKHDFIAFMIKCAEFMNMEINYSAFQVVKTLNFMGLNYEAMHSSKECAKILRNNLYKENTNVLSYYVVRMILMTNVQATLNWCDVNNGSNSLLQFKKTAQNQRAFCDFIGKYYNSSHTLNAISCMQRVWRNLMEKYGIKANKNNFLMNNMRMSICELG